jgi:putative copper export protein
VIDVLAVVARAVALAAIVVMTGALAFRWGVLRRWPAARPAPLAEWSGFAASAGAWAAACLLLVTPARLYVQAQGLTMAGDPVLPMMGNVMHTMWGRGLMLQSVASLTMLAGFLCALRLASWGWWFALVAAAGITLSPALMGHAVAAEHLLVLSVLADWIHVAMAGAWIGALAMLALIARSAITSGAGPGESIATLIELFHPVALTCSVVLVVTGVVSLVLRVSSISDLLHSTYGAILAVKLTLTAGVAALGLHHARRGAHLARLGKARGVARSLAAEMTVAALVIAATAALVGTSPPMRMVETDHGSPPSRAQFRSWRGVGRATVLGSAFLMVVMLLGASPARAAGQATVRADTMSMPGMAMSMAPDPLGVSMDRMGSGTSWIPSAAPLASHTAMHGAWDLMFQGIAFAQFDKQSGPRGGEQLGSTNWGMMMATHAVGDGQLQLRTMLSLDALGVTGFGYPVLLQTGEEYQGQPLHDRQHPHDLFMEVGALYQRRIASGVALSLYAAPAGEPALGPVAFIMRPSAMDNPSAPIGHHWQDATHVTFGVLTAGLFTKQWKLEGSWFNGREPDDQRWNFDPIHLDSWSGRLTFTPGEHWSASTSYGFLKSPEALTPETSLHRITASLMYGERIGPDGQLATTLLWGANGYSDHPALSYSGLVESDVVLDRSNTVFGRIEVVQKNADELVVDVPAFNLAPAQTFNVGAISLGYIREIIPMKAATLGAGAMGTVNLVPQSLQGAYGSRTPLGVFVFLRLRPAAARDAGMNRMHMSGI